MGKPYKKNNFLVTSHFNIQMSNFQRKNDYLNYQYSILYTMLQVIANLIGQLTNFFDESLFDLSISVNLTLLLVVSTM